jgi:hypothetical protein
MNNMGGGTWTTSAFTSYSTSVRCMNVSADGSISGNYSTQDMFKARSLDPMLDPKNVVRECVDTDEHPNTIPIILALDVTGSMGDAAVEVAKKLNVVMTKLYDKISDVEFMIMGIGDLACDRCPIQASQFESDIRIAEQLDKVFFEFGGGGNSFESYTAAWYFGSRHTKLDCWSRGKKGIIITMGDERLNPHLPIKGYRCGLIDATGDNLQSDIETKDLYVEASEKFDIYHLDVNHGHRWDDGIKSSFAEYLDDKHFREVTLDSIADTIVDIIVTASEGQNNTVATVNASGEIAW